MMKYNNLSASAYSSSYSSGDPSDGHLEVDVKHHFNLQSYSYSEVCLRLLRMGLILNLGAVPRRAVTRARRVLGMVAGKGREGSPGGSGKRGQVALF